MTQEVPTRAALQSVCLQQEAAWLAMAGALRVFGSQKQSNTKSVYEQLHRWWRIDFCLHRFYVSRFLFCIQELTDPYPIS